MIRHIVSWKLSAQDEAGKDIQGAEIAAAFAPLPAVLPGLLSLSVHRNVIVQDSNFDLVLICDFASVDDHDAYQVHPGHVAAVSVIAERTIGRSCVDFEV